MDDNHGKSKRHVYVTTYLLRSDLHRRNLPNLCTFVEKVDGYMVHTRVRAKKKQSIRVKVRVRG